jgi:hypothetical protein
VDEVIWSMIVGMRICTLIVTIAVFAGVAAGQTTRPAAEAPARWERMVASLSAAIAGRDPQAVQASVPADCRINRFYAEPDSDTSGLFDAASVAVVIGDHAYLSPASGIAADIAQDVNSSSLVSDFNRRALNLDDPHARAIAMRWLAEALNTVDGQLVGVIVLWDSRPQTDDQHRLNFILVEGNDDGKECKFTRIVYGDPLQ